MRSSSGLHGFYACFFGLWGLSGVGFRVMSWEPAAAQDSRKHVSRMSEFESA